MVKSGNFSNFLYNPHKPITLELRGSIVLKNESEFYKELDYYLKVEFVPVPRILTYKVYLKGDYSFMKQKLGLQSSAIFELGLDKESLTQEHDVYWDELTESVAHPSSLSMDYQSFPPVLKIAKFHPAKTKQYDRLNEIIHNINQEIRNDINDIYYVPSLRGFDTYKYSLLSNSSDVIINPENFRIQSEGLATNIAYNSDYCDKISSIMSDLLERKVRFKVIEGPSVLAEIHNGQRWVNLSNEGFGINPLIHLIFQVLVSKTGSLILIEEPEIHLHPSAQSKLSSKLIELCVNEKKCLIITTHSEHVIFGFLEAIMEKKIENTQTGIYFFEYHEAQSRAEALPVNSDGTIQGGLKGFFETDLDHLQKFYDQIGRSENESHS
jgi:hypothetical protein